MKQGNGNNFFLSGYLILNICRPITFRCILVFVAKSSDHQTTNSRDEQRSLVACRTLGRRSAFATTCHRAATNYCDAPALLAQTAKLFSTRQASAHLSLSVNKCLCNSYSNTQLTVFLSSHWATCKVCLHSALPCCRV